MTSNDYTVTDTQLKRALGELAAGPDAGALAEDVLRVVGTTPQRGRSAWRLPRMSARTAVLATVLLIVAIGGSAVLLSGILPAPRPPGIPGALNGLPGLEELRYVIPEGSDLEVHQPVELAAWYQFNEFSFAQGSVIDVFLAQGSVHPCPPVNEGASRVAVRSTPHEFLVDLREIGGIGIVGEAATTLDGYPAWTAELDADEDRCGTGDLHLSDAGSLADTPVFSGRSGLITVVDVNGSSYAILILAQPDELEAFLPIGNAFLSSVDLVEVSD